MVSEVPGLLHRLLDAVPGAGRTLVAIDGVGASGKTTLAGQLADAISARPVVVLHADDFFHPRSFRHGRGRYSPEGFWQDTYDLDRLVSMALVPLGAGGDGLYRAASYDPVSDRTVRPEPVVAPPDALVVVEGAFLHRDELRRFWDWSVFLDVPVPVASARMEARRAVPPELMARYTGAQEIYFAACAPWERASVVIDTTDLSRPRIIDRASASAARGARHSP